MDSNIILNPNIINSDKVSDNMYLDLLRVAIGLVPLNNGMYASCDKCQKEILGGEIRREKRDGVMTYIFSKNGTETTDTDFVLLKKKLGLALEADERFHDELEGIDLPSICKISH